MLLSVADENDNDEEGDAKFERENEESPNDGSSSSTVPSGSVESIVHQNYPCLCEIYKDPDTQMDMVLLVMCVPGGAQNVTIDLNHDGTAAIIKYNWSKVMFNVEDLFKKFVAAKEMTLHHPKVSCVKSGLEKCRFRIDAAPETTTTINLPIKVQTASNTWKRHGVARDDGSQVIIVEFLGYVKEYHKKMSDSCIIFNK